MISQVSEKGSRDLFIDKVCASTLETFKGIEKRNLTK